MNPRPLTHVVVIGAGMVAHRFVESLHQRDLEGRFRITVIGEESHRPYDRIALSKLFDGAEPASLALGEEQLWEHPRVDFEAGVAATAVDLDSRQVTLADGRLIGYDELVLATGSYPWMPPIAGSEHQGVFVYRTIDDVARIKAWDYSASKRPEHSRRWGSRPLSCRRWIA